jgi:Tol biopolymer transport system component
MQSKEEKMKNNPLPVMVLVFILAISIQACSGEPAATNTSLPATAAPTDLPPTLTSTPIPPTTTPIPPTATPTPQPEYIVFVGKQDSDYDLYRIRPDGSELTSLTSNTDWDGQPAWSPESQRIAFTSDRDGGTANLYTMDLDGGDVQRLTSLENASVSSPSWSPDGTKIAFLAVSRSGNYTIQVIAADGSGQVQIADGFDLGQYFFLVPGVYLGWQPGGEKLLGINGSLTSCCNLFNIFTVNADGTDVRTLTDSPDGDWQPAWSPDGQSIAYYAQQGSQGRFEVFLMNADGSQPTRLADGIANINWPSLSTLPVWSRDGKQLLFATDRDGPFDLYVMNADGSGQVRLTETSSMDQYPVWSPDGSQIALVVHLGQDNVKLHVMNADGSDLAQISDVNYVSNLIWIP